MPLKFVVLIFTVSLPIVTFLQVSEAQSIGEGFCYKRFNAETGECKSRMKQRRLRLVDCCSNGGAGWAARKKDRTSCLPCRTSIIVTSHWGKWGDWSVCNATCGPSFRVRRRACISKGENNCRGRKEARKACKTSPCPIDGGWSPWENWSQCSVSCGKGRETRTRRCTNPVPQFGGKDCQGKMKRVRNCMVTARCPIHGGWGEWSNWSGCSLTCGLGMRSRERKCNSPKPQFGGRQCDEEEKIDFKHCNEHKCAEVHGGWSPWGAWSSCSVTCGKGIQTRSRACTNPVPQFGGKDCQGNLEDARLCMDKEHCPIHGDWGEWTSWSRCSLTCGLGMRSRERKCDSPKPQYGGRPCNETEKHGYRHCREQKCEEDLQHSSGDSSGFGEGWIETEESLTPYLKYYYYGQFP